MIRTIFWWSMVGLMTLPAAVLQAATGGGSTGSGSGGGISLESPLRDIGGIEQLIAAILDVVVLIGAPIAVLFIMYAGFLYVTARGNEAKVSEANKALIAAVIGTAILIGASVISDVIGGTITSLRG